MKSPNTCATGWLGNSFPSSYSTTKRNFWRIVR